MHSTDTPAADNGNVHSRPLACELPGAHARLEAYHHPGGRSQAIHSLNTPPPLSSLEERSANVSVVTITRERPALLPRAIASVESQLGDHVLEHLILIDDCSRTVAALEAAMLPPRVRWFHELRAPGDRSGAARSSVLRNAGVRRARGDWIAFLDDDNQWVPEHIQSLVACATRERCRAVHSHMILVRRDGSPFTEPLVPWKRDSAEAVRAYSDLLRQGVVEAGSPIRRDRLDPLGTPNPVRCVDTGEWLLLRNLLLEVPFCEHFTRHDTVNVITEDDKLGIALLIRGERVASTNRATLVYYLGGYSNNFR